MLVSVSQGAKELGCSVEHIRRQLRAGLWPYYKLGPKTTRIDPEEIKGIGRSVVQANLLRTKFDDSRHD